MCQDEGWRFEELVQDETAATATYNGAKQQRKNFAAIPRTVQDIAGITAVDMALLTAIALHANSRTLESYASRATLMTTAHISNNNTFAASLKRLESAGVLEIERRSRDTQTGGYRSNLYRIRWPKGSFE